MLSLALIIIGALGVGYSFYSTSTTTLQDAKDAIAMSHGDGDKNSHEATAANKHDKHRMTEHHDDAHAKHVLHQLKNRPWSAFYVSLFFFLGITLLVLAFYAIQRAAVVGWSIALFRVMEAITANLHYVSIIMVVFVVAAFMHIHHLFPWMAEGILDPESANFDPLIYGKKMWMNTPGWLMRSIVYLAGWNFYRFYIRKGSLAEDKATEGDLTIHKKNYNASIMFLFFFMITESMMSWDWIMGLDPHWFSTLFGWYILSSLLVSAITVIAFVARL